MNLIAITIACVVLVVGAYVGKKEISQVAETQVTHEEGVLSTTDETITEGDSSVSVTIDNSLASETTTTVTPTQVPSISPVPTNSTQPNSSLDAYLYPGATVESRTSTTASLRSGTDTDTVTNWYKEKIRLEGMNVKTFVTTKANDKVLNKLVGANSQREISIEIKKEPGESTSVIEVKITSK